MSDEVRAPEPCEFRISAVYELEVVDLGGTPHVLALSRLALEKLQRIVAEALQ